MTIENQVISLETNAQGNSRSGSQATKLAWEKELFSNMPHNGQLHRDSRSQEDVSTKPAGIVSVDSTERVNFSPISHSTVSYNSSIELQEYLTNPAKLVQHQLSTAKFRANEFAWSSAYKNELRAVAKELASEKAPWAKWAGSEKKTASLKFLLTADGYTAIVNDRLVSQDTWRLVRELRTLDKNLVKIVSKNRVVWQAQNASQSNQNKQINLTF